VLLHKFGVENPIFLSPMGGGPGTPELAAAVSNAGGLGAIAAGYLTPDQIAKTIRDVRALSDRPLNVNLFVGGYATSMDVAPGPMLALMSAVHKELGLETPVLPGIAPNPFPEQLEAVLEARPEVFSFTFGIPDADSMQRLKARGIATMGTATTVAEARLLAEAGVDAIVAQGSEAGAHRGTFAGEFEDSMVPTLELVRAISAFATVVASGGIMDVRDVGLMLVNGASAVQMGTAFLTCPESGAAESWKQALLSAALPTRRATTVITRAYSGRPARGLKNEFIDRVAAIESSILPFPVQNSLTRAMRTEAAKQGNAGYQSLWAGQGVARCRTIAARDLVGSLL
jgi:nitronate monooxygenase